MARCFKATVMDMLVRARTAAERVRWGHITPRCGRALTRRYTRPRPKTKRDSTPPFYYNPAERWRTPGKERTEAPPEQFRS
eukprot:2077-Chlamydomonas_euryale.AAC.11